MKSLAAIGPRTVFALWLTGCLIVSCSGALQLELQTRSQHEQNFARDARAIAAIVASYRWGQPVESDPRWNSLKKSFNVGAVPIFAIEGGDNSDRSAAAIDNFASAGAGPVAVIAGEVIQPRLSELRWIRDGGGTSLQTTASWPATAADQPQRVQLTRRRPPAPSILLWWLGCAAITLLGSALQALVFYQIRNRNRLQSKAINQWTEDLQTIQLGRKPLLSTAPDREIAFDPNTATLVNIAADAINRTAAELYGETQRSQLVLGNLQEGVLAVNDESLVLLANRALRQYLELPEDEVLYRPLLEVARIPVVSELVQHILKHGTPREEVTEFGTKPRNLRIIGRPLPLGGKRSGALLTVRDETLLKRIEAVRRDFIANASHELKTPLAAIRAYAETLQLGALDDRAAAENFVGSIISQADRIDGLVKGMLQLSRVESGSAVKIEEFEAREALQPCLAAAEAMARGKSIELVQRLPQRPIALRSDRDGFQTIASNLLSNAVRYTPEGGRVEAHLEQDGQECTLIVSDTGIGMNQEDLERIFERFYRAEKGRSNESGGTGLGLSIVKNLANALGGSVAATSEIGKGSRFEVRLPSAGPGRFFLT